jgi:hypothetical protein
MTPEVTLATVFIALILAGVLTIIFGMRHRAKVLEMVHRERLAMIERGLVPPTELPTSPYDQYTQRDRAKRSNRMLSVGIVIVGLGLAIAMLIGFASREPDIAAGVGGAIAVLGAAFIVTALVVHRSLPDVPAPQSRPPSPIERPGVERE